MLHKLEFMNITKDFDISACVSISDERLSFHMAFKDI